MNQGQRNHLENSFFTKLNRINKLTKYAKAEAKVFLNDDFVLQERQISESKFNSIIEEIEELTKEIKLNWSIFLNE